MKQERDGRSRREAISLFRQWNGKVEAQAGPFLFLPREEALVLVARVDLVDVVAFLESLPRRGIGKLFLIAFDQPEDDLDNKFIYEDIVTKLRQEKERRQFLVATHNANIPVLGDAELILVMKAETQNGGLRGRVERSGSIDDPDLKEAVELVLEGGKQAFELRKLKYGI